MLLNTTAFQLFLLPFVRKNVGVKFGKKSKKKKKPAPNEGRLKITVMRKTLFLHMAFPAGDGSFL